MTVHPPHTPPLSTQIPSPESLTANPWRNSLGIGDILALGFGTTVLMWAIGYVGHMPFNRLSSFGFLILMLLANFAGGVAVGRYTPRGIPGGLLTGLVTALLNLLILGSKLLKPETGHLLPHAWLWLPGSIGLSMLLMGLGAALGQRFPSRKQIHWPAVLAWVACIATLLLITAGGLVTGFRAGLAVPDWPNSYGTNMFLYPLKSMTEVRGAYYEHAHRLLGTLVGFTGLTLAIYLTIVCRDRALRILVWTVFAAIAFQGLLGGLRVTGKLTTSQVAVQPSPTLAIVHGVFAHFVLGGLIAVCVLSTKRWQERTPQPHGKPVWTGRIPHVGAATDHFLSAALVLLVIIQTFLGALLRQLNTMLLPHITVAVFVSALVLMVGMRIWGLHGKEALLRRLGITLLVVLGLQITAGLLALAYRDPTSLATVHDAEARAATQPLPTATQPAPPVPTVPPHEAIITTLHQANAAALLGVSIMAALWTRRLLQPATYDNAEEPPTVEPI